MNRYCYDTPSSAILQADLPFGKDAHELEAYSLALNWLKNSQNQTAKKRGEKRLNHL